MFILKNCFVFILLVNLLSCSNSVNESNQSSSKVELIPFVNIKPIATEYSMDNQLISYAFGQQVAQKAIRQSGPSLNPNQFINAFLEGKNNPGINLQEVNQRLNETRRMLSQNPGLASEVTKNLGLFLGGSENGNLFLSNLSIVDFANGFKDVQKGVNSIAINSDSLYSSEYNKFNEFIGKRFLEENKKQEGVLETTTGLQYKIITKGTGALPNENSEVKVHYTGALVSGKIFDSSVKRGQPISFNIQGVIKGWTEGLQLMPVGSKFRFYIPYELGYGAQATSSIPPYSTLVFDVELLAI